MGKEGKELVVRGGRISDVGPFLHAEEVRIEVVEERDLPLDAGFGPLFIEQTDVDHESLGKQPYLLLLLQFAS